MNLFRRKSNSRRARSAERIFERYAVSNHWKEKQSVSGPGSTLLQTETLRKSLEVVLAQLEIKSLVDLPCGDFNWMSRVALPKAYLGLDVSKTVIELNQTRWKRPGVDFEVFNILESPPPSGDLLMCRDLIQHFSHSDAKIAVSNLLRGRNKWIAITTFPDRYLNKKIRTGDWTPYNLELPPFAFPPPDLIINEECTEANGAFRDKSLGIWDVRRLRTHFG